VIAVAKVAKDASEAAPVPGVKAVVGVLVTVLEGVQVGFDLLHSPSEMLNHSPQSVRRNNDDFKELLEQLEWIIRFLGEQLKAGVHDEIEEYCMQFHRLVSLLLLSVVVSQFLLRSLNELFTQTQTGNKQDLAYIKRFLRSSAIHDEVSRLKNKLMNLKSNLIVREITVSFGRSADNNIKDHDDNENPFYRCSTPSAPLG
jgi:hypothetical protein